MRNYLFIALLLALCLGACKKKGNTHIVASNPVGGTPVFMKGTINGTAWTANTSAAYLTVVSNNSNQTDLLINGDDTAKSAVSQISLYVSNFTGAGNFNIDPPAVSATYYMGNNRYYATSGQIILTTYLPSPSLGTYSFIQGTFSFMAGTMNVSGSFSVQLH